MASPSDTSPPESSPPESSPKNVGPEDIQRAKLLMAAQIVSALVHEVNNRLDGLLGRCEDIEECADPARRVELTSSMKDLVRSTTRRMRRYADAFRDPPEQAGAGALLSEALEDALELCKRKLVRGKVALKRPPGIPDARTRWSHGELVRALLELLNNAAESAAGAAGAEVEVSVSVSAAEVSLRVSNPFGSAEPEVARFFEPFFTTKEAKGHLGIGLFLCRGAAERFGSRLSAAVEDGRVALTLSFPREPA